MKKLIGIIFVLIVTVVLSACASGTSLITGTQRPAKTTDNVVIYTEAPENYEVIGIVTASSDSG